MEGSAQHVPGTAVSPGQPHSGPDGGQEPLYVFEGLTPIVILF